MIKFREQKIIAVKDWDNLVKKNLWSSIRFPATG